MRCGATSGLSGGKLARPVLDAEPGVPAVVTPLGVAGETWRIVTRVATKYHSKKIHAHQVGQGIAFRLCSILLVTPRQGECSVRLVDFHVL